MADIGNDAATQAINLLARLLEILLNLVKGSVGFARGAGHLAVNLAKGTYIVAKGGAALVKGAVKLGGMAVDKITSKSKGGELKFKDYMKSIKKGQQYSSMAVPTEDIKKLEKYAKDLGVNFYYLNTDDKLTTVSVPQEKIGAMNEALKLVTADKLKSNPESLKIIESDLNQEQKQLLNDICISKDIPCTSFSTANGKTKTAVEAKYAEEYTNAIAEAKEAFKEMQSVELTDFKDNFPWDDISTTAIEVYPAAAEALAEKYPDDIKIVQDGDKLYAYGDKSMKENIEAAIAENEANKGKEIDIDKFAVSGRETVNSVRQVLFAEKIREMMPSEGMGEPDGNMKYGILDKRKKEFAVIDKNASREQIDDTLKAMGYKFAERTYIMSNLARQYDKNGVLKQSVVDVQQFKTANPDLADIKSSPVGRGNTAIFNPVKQGNDLNVKFCVANEDMTTLELEASIRKHLGITDKMAVAELVNGFADKVQPPQKLDSILCDGKKYTVSQLTSDCTVISSGDKKTIMPKDNIDAAKISAALGISIASANKLKKSIEKSFKVKEKSPKGKKNLLELENSASKKQEQKKEAGTPEKTVEKSANDRMR